MLGDLVTLPLRLTARAASLALRATERVAGTAFTAVDVVTQHVRGGAQSDPTTSETAWPGDRDETARTRVPNDEATSAAAAPAAPGRDPRSHATGQDAPTPVAERPGASPAPRAETGNGGPPSAETAGDEEPVHVSEEPELVEEFAEPGAEDGAGAQITIAEPWEGYAQLNARDVIDRLSASNPEELAAVQLYESAHQSRRTVLEAVQRRLTAANPPRD